MENVVKGDWWESVAEDICELKIDLTLHEVKAMSKEKLKTKRLQPEKHSSGFLVKRKIRRKLRITAMKTSRFNNTSLQTN